MLRNLIKIKASRVIRKPSLIHAVAAVVVVVERRDLIQNNFVVHVQTRFGYSSLKHFIHSKIRPTGLKIQFSLPKYGEV